MTHCKSCRAKSRRPSSSFTSKNQECYRNQFHLGPTAREIGPGGVFSRRSISRVPPKRGTEGCWRRDPTSGASGSGKEASPHSLVPAPYTTRCRNSLA